jgi:ABC-type branched-subunit amino acid transport system substrate-binding protein
MPVSTALLRRALPLLLSLLSASAGAQEILIGHVAGYTGPVMKDATEMGAGAKVLVDAVNSRGGVLGRKVRILVADDNFKPEETAKLIASMSGKVSALLPTTGSANLGLVLKNGVFDKIALPLVGTIPSNESFRTPLRRNIFHFRAGDQAQLEKIVEQLTTVGIKDIAVLARNNPSGAEGAVIVQDALQKRDLKLVVHATYDVAAKDGWTPQVKMMTEKKPGAIILLGTPQGIADVAKALRVGGVESLLYAVSYADFKLIAKVAGKDLARGFVISQVLPNLNNRTLPLIKSFRDDWDKYANSKEGPSHFNLEGYMSARLIVDAIGRSKDPSPQGVIRGLEQMREYDMGGYVVDFSPAKHSGSNWVDLSMISASGALIY